MAVGDSNSVYVYEILGTEYVFSQELRAYEDCSFSCCFAPDGLHFVVASQDGTIVIMQMAGTSFINTTTVKGVDGVSRGGGGCGCGDRPHVHMSYVLMHSRTFGLSDYFILAFVVVIV